MNYEEMWDISHAIGYHAGRWPTSEEQDRQALEQLITDLPWSWRETALAQYDKGRDEGKAAAK